MGGNWCTHSKHTECPTVGLLSWVIPTQGLLFYANTGGKVSYFSRIYTKIVARRLIRLELMPL